MGGLVWEYQTDGSESRSHAECERAWHQACDAVEDEIGKRVRSVCGNRFRRGGTPAAYAARFFSMGADLYRQALIQSTLDGVTFCSRNLDESERLPFRMTSANQKHFETIVSRFNYLRRRCREEEDDEVTHEFREECEEKAAEIRHQHPDRAAGEVAVVAHFNHEAVHTYAMFLAVLDHDAPGSDNVGRRVMEAKCRYVLYLAKQPNEGYWDEEEEGKKEKRVGGEGAGTGAGAGGRAGGAGASGAYTRLRVMRVICVYTRANTHVIFLYTLASRHSHTPIHMFTHIHAHTYATEHFSGLPAGAGARAHPSGA
jgi:hypothetical protein